MLRAPPGASRRLRRERRDLGAQRVDAAGCLYLQPRARCDDAREDDPEVAPLRGVVVDQVLDHGEQEDDRREPCRDQRVRDGARDLDARDTGDEPAAEPPSPAGPVGDAADDATSTAA